MSPGAGASTAPPITTVPGLHHAIVFSILGWTFASMTTVHAYPLGAWQSPSSLMALGCFWATVAHQEMLSPGCRPAGWFVWL